MRTILEVHDVKKLYGHVEERYFFLISNEKIY